MILNPGVVEETPDRPTEIREQTRVGVPPDLLPPREIATFPPARRIDEPTGWFWSHRAGSGGGSEPSPACQAARVSRGRHSLWPALGLCQPLPGSLPRGLPGGAVAAGFELHGARGRHRCGGSLAGPCRLLARPNSGLSPEGGKGRTAGASAGTVAKWSPQPVKFSHCAGIAQALVGMALRRWTLNVARRTGRVGQCLAAALDADEPFAGGGFAWRQSDKHRPPGHVTGEVSEESSRE
jgi:hypothetical protein